MSGEETRRVLEGFLAGLEGRWLAETVELFDLDCPGTVVGRAASADYVRALRRELAHSSARISTRLTVADNRGAVEWLKTPEVSGPQPVIAMLCEVESGEIVRVHLYDSRRKSSSIPCADATEGLWEGLR